MSAREYCLLLCLPFLAHAASGALTGKVVAVADGNTLTVLVSRKQIKVRLTEIDAPERKQPYYLRSRESLAVTSEPVNRFETLTGVHLL